ncbi:hypothetical protein SUGI_1504370 [Cryptomeria japonica]|uniref:RING-type domain-containing protein n=1 Tax=Cryptomeria japonica TaxID=3369 RepID=A0AAD3RRU6_CRYJA|nr:hypothetical protein SUGI_1504370 [Cryptomeria japonica]
MKVILNRGGTEGQTTETIVADSIGNSYRITQMSTVTNDIPAMRRIEVCSTNAEGATTVFETYVCNDGVIADEAIINYIYVDITNPERSICRTVPLPITREQAAEIVGLPTPCLEGNNDPEIICAICLERFGDVNEEIKKLPCDRVFHYLCILRSTQLRNLCPICRRPYDRRSGQQREVR